jgi:hypothetical protein
MLNGRRHGPNPETRCVFGTKIFVDNDDRKAKFHLSNLKVNRKKKPEPLNTGTMYSAPSPPENNRRKIN